MRISQRGVGLVEVIVGAGIASIVLTAITVYMDTNMKLVRGLSQKLESQDLNVQLKTHFVGTNTACDWQVAALPPVNLSAIPTVNTPLTTPVPIAKIYEGTSTASAALVETNTDVRGSQFRLRVSQISLRDIYCVNDCADNLVAANLEVAFDSSTLAVSMAPIRIPMRFIMTAATVLTAKTFASCAGSVGAPIANTTIYASWQERHLGFNNFTNSNIYGRGATVSFPGPNTFLPGNLRQRARITFDTPFPDTNYFVSIFQWPSEGEKTVTAKTPAHIEFLGKDFDSNGVPGDIQVLINY